MKKIALLIAAGAASFFVAGAQPANADDSAANNQKTYTVQSGDTLSYIANLFGIDVNSIAQQNNIANIDRINAGQPLKFEIDEATAQNAVNRVQELQQKQDELSAAAPKIDVQVPSIGEALQTLINRESGGNVNASNGDYFGLGQLSSQLRAVYGGNSTDYNDQLNAMQAYIRDTYGTPENALAHSNAYGWY
ncbi:LysM peptidoglycan-binding domain-containing protein [Leuconostocaceae bacterium ESL0723]|nr:LysM peptidoglycan-binding domain-containing protein [Leuconostocaceae bacterium ESL0723]